MCSLGSISFFVCMSNGSDLGRQNSDYDNVVYDGLLYLEISFHLLQKMLNSHLFYASELVHVLELLQCQQLTRWTWYEGV